MSPSKGSGARTMGMVFKLVFAIGLGWAVMIGAQHYWVKAMVAQVFLAKGAVVPSPKPILEEPVCQPPQKGNSPRASSSSQASINGQSTAQVPKSAMWV